MNLNDVFALKNAKSWKSLLLHENQILLSDSSFTDANAFLEKFNKKSIFTNTKAIDCSSIVQLTHKDVEQPSTLTLKYNKNKTEDIEFANEAETASFANALAGVLQFNQSVETLSTARAVQGPIIGMVVCAAVGWLLHHEASIIEAGGTIEITGRKKLFKQTIATISETLGTTGSIIAALVAIAVCGYFAYNRYKNPPKEIIYK